MAKYRSLVRSGALACQRPERKLRMENRDELGAEPKRNLGKLLLNFGLQKARLRR